jgi:hypothetical protein
MMSIVPCNGRTDMDRSTQMQLKNNIRPPNWNLLVLLSECVRGALLKSRKLSITSAKMSTPACVVDTVSMRRDPNFGHLVAKDTSIVIVLLSCTRVQTSGRTIAIARDQTSTQLEHDISLLVPFFSFLHVHICILVVKCIH